MLFPRRCWASKPQLLPVWIRIIKNRKTSIRCSYTHQSSTRCYLHTPGYQPTIPNNTSLPPNTAVPTNTSIPTSVATFTPFPTAAIASTDTALARVTATATPTANGGHSPRPPARPLRPCLVLRRPLLDPACVTSERNRISLRQLFARRVRCVIMTPTFISSGF